MINDLILNGFDKLGINLADFDPDVHPDAPKSMSDTFTKVMNFMQYAGLVIMIVALIGAGVSFGLTHNREDASESLVKLVKPCIGVAIIAGEVGLITFLIGN
jgi:hypothetical protein